MTEQNEFQAFFTGSTAQPSAQPRRLFIDEPPPPPPAIEQAHAGYAPMDRIALEGQAYRGLASGDQPWWVIITAWLIFATAPFFGVMYIAGDMIANGFDGVGVLFLLIAIALFLLVASIMYRGTHAKLIHQQETITRRNKYRSEIRN